MYFLKQPYRGLIFSSWFTTEETGRLSNTPKVSWQVSGRVTIRGLADCVLALAPKSHLCAFLSNSSFSDGSLVVGTQPWRGYLHHGNRQALQIKGFYLFCFVIFVLKSQFNQHTNDYHLLNQWSSN